MCHDNFSLAHLGKLLKNQLVRQKINLFSNERTSVKVFTELKTIHILLNNLDDKLSMKIEIVSLEIHQRLPIWDAGQFVPWI